MKAVIREGAGTGSWTQVPDPAMGNPEDAIVGVDAVTICGKIRTFPQTAR